MLNIKTFNKIISNKVYYNININTIINKKIRKIVKLKYKNLFKLKKLENNSII